MKKNLLFVFFALLPMVASAFTGKVEIDGIYYNLITKAKIAEVTINPNKYSGEVVIPSSVTYNDVEYSVTSIGNGAFLECTSLTSVTIPNSVTSIGFEAFRLCSSLTSITIPNSVTSVGESAFDGTAWYNNQPDGLVYAGKVAYKYKGDMPENTKIILNDGTLGICGYAFYECTSLTSITIPNSVTIIGEQAFRYCSSLTSILVERGNAVYDSRNNCNAIIETSTNTLKAGCKNTIIPNSVTSIGISAFTGSGLTSITIPNSVTSIGSSAFYYCSSLTSITIGSGVKNIYRNAFRYCSELTDVYCYAVNVPQTVTDAFDDSKVEYATLHVPDESLEQYKNTSPWSSFGKIVGLSTEIIFIEKDHSASVLIQNNGGMLTVQGAQDGTPVSVYTIAGTEAGSAVSQNSMACISTSMQQGDIAIVRIGNRSVKVVLK